MYLAFSPKTCDTNVFCFLSFYVIINSLAALCPDDYIVGYDYGCYQFNSEHMTWEAARAHCRQAVDGDLAIIDEEAEMNFLLENQLLEQYDWWIGEFQN